MAPDGGVVEVGVGQRIAQLRQDRSEAPQDHIQRRTSERIKDALKRAGASQKSELTKAQADRAAEASPQRRGKALLDFIMSGEKKAGPPREARQINWDTPFKKGDSPGYLAMISIDGGKNFELVDTFQGLGLEGEKNLAEKLGVSFPEGLRDLVAKDEVRVLSMNARYVNLSDGSTERGGDSSDE